MKHLEGGQKRKMRPETARKEKKRMNDEIGFTCDLCGACDDVPSIVTMTANYGSTEHDGDKVALRLCGHCIDLWMDSLPDGAGQWERVVSW